MEKVAIITGASSGLGAAIADVLAGRGYKLVLTDINAEKLHEKAEELKAKTMVHETITDVRNKKDCERLILETVEKFGRVDVVINNAAIWRMAKIEEMEEEDIKNIFATNTFGPMFIAKAAVEVMKRQNSGHILSIGSTAVVDNKSSYVGYAASKAALITFSGCLRTELLGTGIRVSVISPSGMMTHLFDSKPERIEDHFMDPHFVAERILEHMENPDDDWHRIVRNDGK